MKHTITIKHRTKMISLLVLAIYGFFFFACGSDSSSGNGNNDAGSEQLSLEDLAGTYELYEFSETDTRDGSTTSQADAAEWEGRMVIGSGGMIQFDMTVDDQAASHSWTVLSVENDALELEENGCIEWVDMLLEGDRLTLVYPVGDCDQNYNRTWKFIRIDESEDTSTSTSDDTTTDTALTLTDLVGTYNLTGFSMTSTEDDGFTIDEEDYDNWSGRMVIGTDGVMDFTQTVESDRYNFVWEILAVGNDWLQLQDDDCVQQVYINYTDGSFLLTWPEGECLEGVTATYRFTKTSTATSLSTGDMNRLNSSSQAQRISLSDLFETLKR